MEIGTGAHGLDSDEACRTPPDVGPRRSGAGGLAAAVVLALVAACVNLAPPSVTRCLPSNHICDDAGVDGSSDGGRDARAPDAIPTDAPPPDALPVDATAPDLPDSDAGLDGIADRPADLPPDRTPDLSPDLTPDRPADTAPDTTPDRAPDTGPAASCPTGDPSLLLCLRFEGSLADESSPAATVTGSNITFESGIDTLAARLGTASLLRAAQGWGAVDTVFTLEAWIRPDRLPGAGDRMGIIDSEAHFGIFLLPGGTISCSSSGGEATASAAAAAGRWTAVACTASANTLVLWIDGVARDQAPMDGNSNGTPSTLGIGGNLPSGDPWEGLIDNVRVWSTARTAQQISAHTPPSP
jgi:hypothetical protein